MRGMAQTSRSDPAIGGAVPTLLAHIELGQYRKAIEDFDQTTRLDPHHRDAEQEREIAVELAEEEGT